MPVYVRFLELIQNHYIIHLPIAQLAALDPNYALLSRSLMDVCRGIEPATHRGWLIRGDMSKCVNFRFLLVSVSRTTALFCERACVATTPWEAGVTQDPHQAVAPNRSGFHEVIHSLQNYIWRSLCLSGSVLTWRARWNIIPLDLPNTIAKASGE